MEYRSLGRTNISVSTICMGCWGISGASTWGPQDESDAVAAIRASLDEGVTFFDTAETYGFGRSELLLGQALSGRRDGVVVATKAFANHLAPGNLRKACEESLGRLRTDVIDLYQIHFPGWDVPLSESMDTLERLRSEGKIRAYGVCNFGKGNLAELLAWGRAESNQVCHSLLWRAIEFDVQSVCIDNDVSILSYSPLAMGLLTGKFESADDVPEGRATSRIFSADRPNAGHGEPGCEGEAFEAIRAIREISADIDVPMNQLALAWCMAQPGVASVIAGSRNARQARDNARAADLKLPDEVLQRLSQATETVKTRLGPRIDPWNTEWNVH